MAKAPGDQQEGLVDLLNNLNSTILTVPDELTENILRKAGVDCSDVRTVRLVSLAAQKFVSDIVEEARRVQENRYQAPQKLQQSEGLFVKDKKPILLTEDLTAALQQFGVSLQRPPYQQDGPR